MKVSELIELLQTCNLEHKVIIQDPCNAACAWTIYQEDNYDYNDSPAVRLIQGEGYRVPTKAPEPKFKVRDKVIYPRRWEDRVLTVMDTEYDRAAEEWYYILFVPLPSDQQVLDLGVLGEREFCNEEYLTLFEEVVE